MSSSSAMTFEQPGHLLYNTADNLNSVSMPVQWIAQIDYREHGKPGNGRAEKDAAFFSS